MDLKSVNFFCPTHTTENKTTKPGLKLRVQPEALHLVDGFVEAAKQGALNSPRRFLNEQLQASEVSIGCSVVSRHSSTVCLHLGHSTHRKQPLNDLRRTEASREVKGCGPAGISILKTFTETAGGKN